MLFISIKTRYIYRLLLTVLKHLSHEHPTRPGHPMLHGFVLKVFLEQGPQCRQSGCY